MLFRRLGAFVALISLGIQQVSSVCNPVWALPVDPDSELATGVYASGSVSPRQETREVRKLVSQSVTGTGVPESFLEFDVAGRTARLCEPDGKPLQENLSLNFLPPNISVAQLETYLVHHWFSVLSGEVRSYGRLLGGWDHDSTPSGCSDSWGISFQNNSSYHVSTESGGQGGGSTYMHPVAEAPTAPSTPAAAPCPAPAKMLPTVSDEKPNPFFQQALVSSTPLVDRLFTSMTSSQSCVATPPAHIAAGHAALENFFESKFQEAGVAGGVVAEKTGTSEASWYTQDCASTSSSAAAMVALSQLPASVPLPTKLTPRVPSPVFTPTLSVFPTAFEEHIASLSLRDCFVEGSEEERPSSPSRLEDTDYEAAKTWMSNHIPDLVKDGVQTVFSTTIEGLDLVTLGGTSITLEHLNKGLAACGSTTRKGFRALGVPQRTAQNMVDWLDVGLMVAPTRAGMAAVSTVARVAKASALELKGVSVAKIATVRPLPPPVAPKPALSVKQRAAAFEAVAKNQNPLTAQRKTTVLTADHLPSSSKIKALDRPGFVEFDSVEFRAVRNLEHLSEDTLQHMARSGKAPRDISGKPLVGHHHLQQYHRDPGAFVVEIPESAHSITKQTQHPHEIRLVWG